MTKQEKIVEIKRNIEDSQRKSALLKERLSLLESESDKLVIFDGWTPAPRESYFVISLDNETGAKHDHHDSYECDFRSINRKIVFSTHEQAEAVADAIAVMLELRHCEGAGTSRGEISYVYCLQMLPDGGICYKKEMWRTWRHAPICPCFPAEDLLDAALDAVGRERVERALLLWGMQPVWA